MGYVAEVNPLPGEISSNTISSTGIGVRITDGKYLSISSDYGFILEPLAGGKGTGSGRWHLAMSFMY
jgi:hemolysin activation/secretion protein